MENNGCNGTAMFVLLVIGVFFFSVIARNFGWVGIIILGSVIEACLVWALTDERNKKRQGEEETKEKFILALIIAVPIIAVLLGILYPVSQGL